VAKVPYRIESNCVYKEGEEKPLKCYKGKNASARAEAYLKALYANVTDASVVFEQVNGPFEVDIEATADEGDILVFKNAVLARAEVNRNRDEIDAEGIEELAATIAGRPIDFEHDVRMNIGVYTAGRSIGDSLSVDGMIWADRYPKAADDIRAGILKQSIEANAKNAMCSICSGVFASKDEYCEHLKGRRENGAVRKLKGLKAKGGGVTYNPAGTNPSFSANDIFMVASHQEDIGEKVMDEKEKVEVPVVVEASDNAKAFEETIASLNKAIETMKADLEAEKKLRSEAEAKASDLEAKLKNRVLASAFTSEEIEGLAPKLATWNLDQIELLASTRTAPKRGGGPVGIEVTGNGGKEPLTLTFKGVK
jgi:hypothetical protein